MRDPTLPYRDDPPKPDSSTALHIAFWVFMVGMLLVSTLMVAGDAGRGVGAMPQAARAATPVGAQPQAASCQHDIPIANGELA